MGAGPALLWTSTTASHARALYPGQTSFRKHPAMTFLTITLDNGKSFSCPRAT